MHRLFLRASNWTRRNETKRNNTKRSLRFEQFEGRQLMTVSPYAIDSDKLGNLPVLDPGPSTPEAVGTVNFDAATGVLKIEGSDVQNDKVEIFINKRSLGGAGNIPDLLTVKIGNINTPLVRVFDPTQVKSIIVHTYGGDDTVDNRTSVPMDAYLGKGNDTGLGGAASDLLFGDDGDDWLDGRDGDDTLIGGNGSDKIFGDLGNDDLYGGANNDFLFGGRGNDRMKGEAGNDTLFGGTGTDKLTDTDGTNLMETDYGHIPDRAPTINSFKSFWVFDHEFADPTVRSMLRLSYRDMEISRGDMLNIYNAIATDGVETSVPFNGSVSSHEYYDLKDMLGNQFPLNFAPSVKYLSQQVILGNYDHAQFEGKDLGILQIGSSGHKLNKLVDNWFKGGDLPTFTGNATYKAVQGSLFVNGASFKDITQGQATDSGFLAQLGEVAMHSQSTISNMFIDNGDGTFVVKFFKADKSTAFVTVNNMLPTRNDGTALFAAFSPAPPVFASYALAGDGSTIQGTRELWVALAEKGYAQFLANGSPTGSYDSLNGADAGVSFQHLTNKVSQLFHIRSTTNQSVLIDLMDRGRAITIHSKATVALGMTPNADYMVVSHQFVNGVVKFELRNATGFENPTKTLLLSWNELTANFSKWTSVLL